MIYVTSDWHFNHDRDFIWKPRGFKNVYEMNQATIERHNEIVEPEDTVYVLGDLCLGGGDEEALRRAKHMIQSLKGNLKVILGNHDTNRRVQMYESCWNVKLLGYADVIKYDGYHFYLSHYPTITSNLDYDKPLRKRTLNLFGHTHSNELFYKDNPMMYNVAQDAHNCYPVSMEKVVEDIKEKFSNTNKEQIEEIDIKVYKKFLDNYMNNQGGD